MKVEFYPQDIEAIARQVVEAIRPMLLAGKDKKDDAIFDVQGLADYLKVHPSWVYKNAANIPHFKSGKYLRLRNPQWINGLIGSRLILWIYS